MCLCNIIKHMTLCASDNFLVTTYLTLRFNNIIAEQIDGRMYISDRVYHHHNIMIYYNM